MRKFYLFLIIAVIMGSMITFGYLYSAVVSGMNNRQGVVIFSDRINMSISLSGNKTIGLSVSNRSLDFGTVSDNGDGLKNIIITNKYNKTATYFFIINGNISDLYIMINGIKYNGNNKVVLKRKEKSSVRIEIFGNSTPGTYYGTMSILGVRGNITSFNLSS